MHVYDQVKEKFNFDTYTGIGITNDEECFVTACVWNGITSNSGNIAQCMCDNYQHIDKIIKSLETVGMKRMAAGMKAHKKNVEELMKIDIQIDEEERKAQSKILDKLYNLAQKFGGQVNGMDNENENEFDKLIEVFAQQMKRS
jgi:hypothetical protein